MAEETYEATFWFSGVPILEIGPLANQILARGWFNAHGAPGEWWCAFSQPFENEQSAAHAIAEVQKLFGEYWVKCEWGRLESGSPV
jgi:hypothetical protein